jgi:glycosyltransferase involved in cell wall biosynthesis
MNNFPTIIFIRGWRWNFFKKIKQNKILTKIFISNLKKADKILVLSDNFKRELLELEINEETIHTTSTMVESDRFLPSNKKFDKPYKILFCGNLKNFKGPYELLDAIPFLLNHEKNLKIIFMGNGPELNNLKSKTKEMSIEKFVSFIGYKKGEEKYNIFKNSHIFVIPSYTEGFPNVFLEAMAAGLPIISTSVGGLKNAFKDGKNGFMLKSNPPDPIEISINILKLINNHDIMINMSEFNIKEAKNKYDVAVVTKKIEKIYKDIIIKQKNYHEKEC